MSECDLDTPVPEWVIDHPETLTTFQELGIDYCCGGKSLAHACRERGLDAAAVLEQLRHSLHNVGVRQTGQTLRRRHSMAIPHAQPGEVIDVRPLGASLATAKTTTLLKSSNIEVVRLVMTAGKEIAEHKAPGEITVHCLEGKVAFTALGQTHELTAGQMLYLGAGEPHSVKCIEDASFLLTILL
jgi:quercetin dioxygenase-like cupin family protein